MIVSLILYCCISIDVYCDSSNQLASTSAKPDWAKKGKAAEALKKTDGGDKIYTKEGGGNLAKPITNIRDHMK